MTSRDRVLAAMRCQQPDRVPIHMRGVDAWNPEWVAAQDTSYRPVIDAVLEHCDLIPMEGAGGVWSPFLSSATDDITEVDTRTVGEWVVRRTTIHTPLGEVDQESWSTPTTSAMTRKHFVETPEDVRRVLSVPYRRAQVDIGSYLELRGQWPDHAVLLYLPQPAGAVWSLFGTFGFAWFWAEHRSLLYELREAFVPRALDALDDVLAAGAGPVLATHGVETVAPPIHSPQTYRDFALPTFREYCSRLHAQGCLLHVHCHNRLSAVLEDIRDVGWDVTHPIEPPPLGDVDLADAKRRVGAQLCLEGNIQIGDVYAAPTERVVEVTREAMATGKPGGGFILCPTASPHTAVLSEQTVANYVALIETAVSMRDY